MKQVAIGIIGYGTVGQGVVEVLRQNEREILRRTGYTLKVVCVAKRDWRGIDQSALPFVCETDPFKVVQHPEVDIVLELMGGEEPAKSLIEAALSNGKHVITANKALIARHGESLFTLAKQKGLDLAFEASVAGGIPVIKVLREAMSANEISEVVGIINGTSNFILTEMAQKGREFMDVLREAQALGYAEADPSFDINGTDAAHKITILASIAFGIPLQFDKVYIEGIERLTPEDIQNAADLGYKIKHLGMAIRRNDGVEIRVHPTLIPQSALLSSVNGVMNAVQVKGNAVGNSLYYGPGAGRLPTASAVVADLVDIVRELNLAGTDRLPEFGYEYVHQASDLPVLESGQFVSAYYLRLNVSDRAGVLADVTAIMAKHHISIQSIIQKVEQKQGDLMPLILMTERVRESQLQSALQALQALESVHGAIQCLRVESIA
ncbi:MAG: homoserine dehydrogenase [Cardiobacteriaceae bacterium]|nr:homoserine dehydrogenase [Cardiobacteriaceae bacterium]